MVDQFLIKLSERLSVPLFALFSEPLTASSRLGRIMLLILAVVTKFLKRLEQNHANLLVPTCIKAPTCQSEPQSS